MNDTSQDHAAQIRQARGKFAAMAGCYALGVFNDNFFKQAMMLVALAAGRPELQGYAAAVFTLPFILFAAPAGWLADRFPKRRIVIASKAMELVAMACGAAGLCTGHWPLMFAMLFLMGLQATIFGPALNGSIPELYPESHVLTANAILKSCTTAAILAGIILAGFSLSDKSPGFFDVPRGKWIVAVAVVAVAVVGVLASLGVPRRPAADAAVQFPWRGPLDTVQALWRTRRTDPLLGIVIGFDAFIWFVAVAQALLINLIGATQFQLGEERTSILLFAELVGVAIGGLLSARVATGGAWRRLLPLSAGGMGVAMLLMPLAALAPARFAAALAVLLAMGVCGGVALIPLESLIQVRPPAKEKGRMIAAGNFAAFVAMTVSGLATNGLSSCMSPTTAMAVIGGATMAFSLWMLAALRRGDHA